MGELRKYPREELTAAMICAFNAEGISTFCLVKNVSVDGALVECPLAEELETFDMGDPVALRDILTGSKALFSGETGVVAWIYKRFIGIHFEPPLLGSSEELHEWLACQHLI